MSIEGWYYLHTNGSLIYKPDVYDAADIRESDFAVALWPIDPSNRANAWQILVESLSAGADLKRVEELAEKWGCDDEDALQYAKHIGFILTKDGNSWMAARNDFINIQESPCGFGVKALDAMVNLCSSLGYKPAKMWGNDFHSLIRGG